MSTTKRILCIDDDVQIRDMLKRLLTAASYEVWETGSGREGLELAGKSPDLIILDIGLPDIDGFEICTRLKTCDTTRTIPLLQISGKFTEDEDRVTGLEGGADAYLVKPVPNRVLLATVHSLLRLHDVERSLAAAVKKAEAASAAKTRFLSRITSRLRLPLNAIIGFSGQLEDSALTPRQRECADNIRGNSQRLLALVNDLLDAARLDLHGVALEVSDFDPRAACADVFAMLRKEAAAKDLILECICAQEIPASVRADVGRFRQVLVHLVENAIRFTPRGGVTVRLANNGSVAAAEGLLVEVEDTGPGVPADFVSSLFQPLSILMDEHPAPESGSGLGLAIAHAVVKLMGGSMGHRPAEGGGAVFWFRIPVQSSAADASEPSCAAYPQPVTNARILLVDDNAVNLKVAGKILSSLGYDVVSATGGMEAVKMARHEKVALVFMDLQMPDVDGFEATRRIREGDSEYAGVQIPIVALTAQTDEDSKRRCANARMDGYITKPVSRAAMDEAISRLLRQPPPARAVASPSDPASQGAAITPPVFDSIALLERMDGDRAVVRDILEIFLTGVPSDLKLLDDGMYQCNAKLVARQAHSIKGMTANVGAEATRHAAEALEAAVKQGDWDHARALFSQLTTTLHAASGAIRKELDVMTRVLPPVDGSRTADDAMNQTAPPPVQRPSDGPIRTLIVDDSAAMRGMLSRLLEPFPIEVIGQANSMEEAQRLTTELVPELLFLDVVMPGGSGIDLLHKLRDLPIPPAVVMLSSVAERATIVESKRCGAIDYLLKPFDSDTLRRCVARVHARLRKP